MQLKSLFYIAPLFSIAVARVADVQTILNYLPQLNDKVYSLHGGIDRALQSDNTASIALALELYQDTMGVVGMADEITRTAKNCPELSDDDTTTILNSFYQMQPTVETSLKLVVDKKDIVDKIPGGRGAAIVGLGLGHMKDCLTNLHVALAGITPIGRLPEANDLAAQIHTACDGALSAYP